MTNTSERFTLRQLPLPAKLVATAFLISVGAGYLAAMIQLHFKHGSGGEFMPGIADVVARFSGQPWPLQPRPQANDGAPKPEGPEVPKVNPVAKAGQPGGVAPAGGLAKVPGAKIKSIINERCARCHGPEGEKDDVPLHDFAAIGKLLNPEPAKSHIRKVISAGQEQPWDRDNMSSAFTNRSIELDGDEELKWRDQIKARPQDEIRKERDVERLAFIAWLDAGAPEAAYAADAFPLPKELVGQPLTERFKTEATPLPQAPVAKKGEANGNGDKSADPWRKAKARQISAEALAQSTHAHLLSFAMLWALTGIIFAFTSYPLWMRAALAPMVLVVQMVDIACWWLARLPESGPYFAIAVMGTGALVGMGIMAQIVLSLFNMYGRGGKAVLAAVFIAGTAGAGLVYVNHVKPQLEAEKLEAKGAQH